jgi:hypothetical protein
MIIPNINKTDICGKSGFYWDLREQKNGIKNQENVGTMLLESRSVPVQDDTYFQDFWPSDLCLGYGNKSRI